MSDRTQPPAIKSPPSTYPSLGPRELPPPLGSGKSNASAQDSTLANMSSGWFGDDEKERSLIFGLIAGGLFLMLTSILLFSFASSNAGNAEKGAGADQARTEIEGAIADDHSQVGDAASGDPGSELSGTKDAKSEDPLANTPTETAQPNESVPDAISIDEEAILTRVPNRQQQIPNPTTSGGIDGSRGGSKGIDLSSTEGINPFVGEGKKAATTVFVIDVSSSMLRDSKLPRVLSALKRAIDQLGEDQQFCVILFDNSYYLEPSVNGLIKASKRNKSVIQNWLVDPPRGGGTDPMAAMPQAIGLGPERIVLLSDGEFDPTNVILITSMNKQRVRPARIDCVGLMEDVQVLRDIAQQNQGVYYQAW
jgi:Mg-chelatase subunit ChlD